jgi:hypothetical protein
MMRALPARAHVSRPRVVTVVVFGVGSVAMLLAHVSPIDGFGALFDGAFGTPERVRRDAGADDALLFPRSGSRSRFAPDCSTSAPRDS